MEDCDEVYIANVALHPNQIINAIDGEIVDFYIRYCPDLENADWSDFAIITKKIINNISDSDVSILENIDDIILTYMKSDDENITNLSYKILNYFRYNSLLI